MLLLANVILGLFVAGLSCFSSISSAHQVKVRIPVWSVRNVISQVSGYVNGHGSTKRKRTRPQNILQKEEYWLPSYGYYGPPPLLPYYPYFYYPPVTKKPTRPPTQSSTKPPTKPPTDTPTDPPTKPPTEPPTAPPTDPPTDPPTKPPTEPPTDPPTKPPTVPPTDPPTEPPTDPPTKPPTDPPTDPPTKPPTDPPTDPPTKPPTEPPTDPPTEPPTEPPTDPPTKPPTDPPPTTLPPWPTKPSVNVYRSESSICILHPYLAACHKGLENLDADNHQPKLTIISKPQPVISICDHFPQLCRKPEEAQFVKLSDSNGKQWLLISGLPEA